MQQIPLKQDGERYPGFRRLPAAGLFWRFRCPSLQATCGCLRAGLCHCHGGSGRLCTGRLWERAIRPSHFRMQFCDVLCGCFSFSLWKHKAQHSLDPKHFTIQIRTSSTLLSHTMYYTCAVTTRPMISIS